ncbi:MAG: hypothetical protein ACTSSN_00095 [Candidatus Heimdallarchaeaceae archaeon]
MYDEHRTQKVARIVEIPIPLEFFDMLQDLVSYYGNNDKAVLESIKAHHKEMFGSLDDFRIQMASTVSRGVKTASGINTPVTDGRLARIIENGKKFEQKTQREIEKVDKLLDKLEDITVFKELKEEISSMKSMIERIQSTGVITQRPRGPKADLSSLEIGIADSVTRSMSPPERPLLDTVLDSMLFFDDEELAEDSEEENKEETEKN